MRRRSLAGGTLYCTMEPCRTCAMLIINCGIVRVVAKHRYHAAEASRGMFAAAGVELAVVRDDVLSYDAEHRGLTESNK